MEQFLNLISKEMESAFEAAGYDSALGRVTVSNRPDLCEYQCNGAMAGAKRYHKAPFMIADDVAKALAAKNEGTGSDVFSKVEVVKPGFLNLDVDESFLRSYLQEMSVDDRLGMPVPEKAEKIIIDYGGPNVAKPLHVGHLRSAVIGEAVKRIARFHGEDVIGDIHLGDWGLQMGLVITELKKRMPDLPYFDPDYTGEYPEEAPFTVSELEEIYPFASAKSKQDPDYYAEAMDNTRRLQEGERGLYALWQKIVGVSVADMKRNYENLNVSFDLWNGEASVHPVIPGMVEDMKKGGYAYESQGALVIDVAEETDAKEIPPCIVLKSDGASLYTTTDLATIKERVEKYNPDKIIYITDKRQELHFTQVFRAAVKSGLAGPDTKLIHIGFGTMNGKDGKPFKTRAGGVMRLETLINEITDFVRAKVEENKLVTGADVEDTTAKIALAALKYGDLMNAPTKDYIFDLDRFAAFEGNTGPYILYTIVRIKSILARCGAWEELSIAAPETPEAKDLMLALTRLPDALELAYRDCAPNAICAYIYELAGYANKFYHETRILAEEDKQKQQGYIALIGLTKRVLETCIDLLGFSAPEKM